MISDGNNAIVTGRDNNSGGGCKATISEESWRLVASTNGNEILIDFSPKGGPRDLVGKWDGGGIVFPDGNRWRKMAEGEDYSPPARIKKRRKGDSQRGINSLG